MQYVIEDSFNTIGGSAVGQNYLQEQNLPNLMAKPVNKFGQVQYNL